MATVTLDLPVDVVGESPDSVEQFAKDMRLAAALFWYAKGRVSQSRAAQVAGLSRAAFIEELSKAKVEIFQVDADDLRGETVRG